MQRSYVERPFRQLGQQTAFDRQSRPQPQWFPSVENLPLIPLTTLPLPAFGGSKFEKRHLSFLANILFGLPWLETTEATMKKQEELVVISKTYDLILWSRQ